MAERKVYLGDGAYAEWAEHTGDLLITTSDGLRNTNEVVLGATEFRMLVRFAAGDPSFLSVAKAETDRQ